jgi:hypothetical protein
MTPTLKFIPGRLAVEGAGVYKSADMTLEYVAPAPPPEVSNPPKMSDVIDQEFGLVRHGDFLLIADTLTLTFSGMDRRLVGLDAYTNRQLWSIRGSQPSPEVTDRGKLVVAELGSLEDDRYPIQSVPKYEVASDDRWVRIVLADESADSYFEVACNFVVGLKEGRITCIYLFDVTFT